MDVDLYLVETVEDVNQFFSWLSQRRPILGFDTETEGLDWWRDDIRLFQFGDARTGWAFDARDWFGVAKQVFDEYEGPMVAHNAKFDLHVAERAGARPTRTQIHDTMFMASLYDHSYAAGLKPQSARIIDPGLRVADRALKKVFQSEGWFWDTIPIDHPAYWQYSALDPVMTAKLWEHYDPLVTGDMREMYETELACSHVLVDMETRGVRLDFDYIHGAIPPLEDYVQTLRDWVTLEYGIENINSDAQGIDWFERVKGHEFTKLTDKGNTAFDREVLEGLDHPLARAILKYRDADKLLSSYLRKYIELADGEILHASVHPVGARTGRMSVSRPSLQNIPRSFHPRGAFIARDGRRLVLSDYDQIEMRLLAHFANEQAMIEAIRYGDQMTAAGYDGYDVHSMNARGIYGIPFNQPVPKPKRDVTKNSGFAKIFGAGVEQFARTAGIPVPEAKAFLNAYNATYPGVDQFQSRVAEYAVKSLQSEQSDGRPFIIAPDGRRHVTTKNKIYRLVNYLVQGTAAVVLKRAIVEMARRGLDEHLILPVHDELIADVPVDEIDQYAAEMKDAMEVHGEYVVPLTVDTEIVDCWGDKYA